jgi:hypothetical protein
MSATNGVFSINGILLQNVSPTRKLRRNFIEAHQEGLFWQNNVLVGPERFEPTIPTNKGIYI